MREEGRRWTRRDKGLAPPARLLPEGQGSEGFDGAHTHPCRCSGRRAPRARSRWDSKAWSGNPGPPPCPLPPQPRAGTKVEVGPTGGLAPRGGTGRSGLAASLKPGCGGGARSTGARSGRAPDLSAGLSLRSVSGRAPVSHARARQRRRFPAEHGAASEGRGPGGAAQGRSWGLAAGRRAAGAGAWTATLVTAAFAPACRA